MEPPETAERRGLALIDARRYREAVKVLRPAVDKMPHIPPAVAEAAFFIGVIAAAVGAWLWARRQRRRLSPLVVRVHDEDWWRQRGLYVLRYLFRFLPVLLVVVSVAVLGFTEHVGYLPWIVAGGILVIAWWFAWRPAWRRVVAIFDRQ